MADASGSTDRLVAPSGRPNAILSREGQEPGTVDSLRRDRGEILAMRRTGSTAAFAEFVRLLIDAGSAPAVATGRA